MLLLATLDMEKTISYDNHKWKESRWSDLKLLYIPGLDNPEAFGKCIQSSKIRFSEHGAVDLDIF